MSVGDKSQNQIRAKAISLKPEMIEFLKKHIGDFGQVTDQLRVMGYLGQAMVDMANTELLLIKQQMDQDEKHRILLPN